MSGVAGVPRASLRSVVRALVPPIVLKGWHALRRRALTHVDMITPAPLGWDTPLTQVGASADFWRWNITPARISGERALIERLRANDPDLFRSEVNDEGQRFAGAEYISYMTVVYALAVAARQKLTLSILDYGGGPCDYYWLVRAMLPDLELDYHCFELPPLVELGRELAPDVVWHSDATWMERRFDVVMFNTSLQYLRDWHTVIPQAASAADGYLLLTQVPTVLSESGFVVLQRTGGSQVLAVRFSRSELIDTVRATGFQLVREFPMAQEAIVYGAPEQPSPRGFLFKRIIP